MFDPEVPEIDRVAPKLINVLVVEDLLHPFRLLAQTGESGDEVAVVQFVALEEVARFQVSEELDVLYRPEEGRSYCKLVVLLFNKVLVTGKAVDRDILLLKTFT